MGLNKTYNIGDLIELCTEQNAEGKYGADDVRGMTIDKKIIPTKANVKDTDLAKFLVIRPREFVYNPRTHGKRIGMGFNSSEDTFVISWNNIGFRVKDTRRNVIEPEYLFMNFNRLEWDRSACFRSWGTSTEVFSWEALCDMHITLPPLERQRQAVAVYQGLKDNLTVYEQGLEDLKTTCDGFIDKLRHDLPGTRIGQYLQYSDARNDAGLGEEQVRGLSIEKKLIPTKADMKDVDLDKYKVLRPTQFAYVPVTSRNGGKLTIANNDTDETFLVSAAYEVFSTDRTSLLPEYLMMFFHRAEFDRYARFHSWGSARETFAWQDLCDVRIPLPEVKVQQAVADIYRCYIERQRIAAELRQQLQDICPVLVRGALGEV